MPANSPIYLPYDDYAQSANTLFHFMKKQEYLNSILRRGAIIPRYCVETIDYLSIQNGTHLFNEVAILQKCFCDIPFHKLADSFAVNGVGDVYESLSKDERADLEKNNTHFAYYGEYAVAFSKSWGEKKHLQPVHYLNKDSQYAKDFSALFSRVLLNALSLEEQQDIDELYLLLCEKKVVRLSAKLTSTSSTAVTMNNAEASLSIGDKIALTFIGSIEFSFLKQSVTLHTANLLINALVKDIQKCDDGTVRVLYGDTDSKPMYISFSAFQTSEEAKQESETIMQHESIYVNALTSNAYITQYYEEQ